MPALLTPPVVDDATRREFLAALAAAGLLVGCSAERGSDPVGGDGFPRTVRHAGGDLVIPGRPGRVVVHGAFSEFDVLLALGVTPVARGEFGPDEIRSWQRAAGASDVAALRTAGGTNLDLEALAALAPDLMVMNGTTLAGYPADVAAYTRVCPVLALPDGIEEQLTVAATALGIPDDVVAAATAGVQDALDAFAPAYRPSTIVIAEYFGAGELLTWTRRSLHAALLRRCGLPDPSAPEDGSDAQIVPVSMERIDLLDAGVLLVSDGPAVDELEANPLFANLDVVRTGRYTRLTKEETFAVGDVTVLSLPIALAALTRALA